MLGKFNADGIQVECETDSSNLWIVDADGVYIEQSPLHSIMQEECLNAINAKYGTNFTTLTMQKVTSIAIGDDCPDWDAYEKIEMPKYLKLPIAAGARVVTAAIIENVFRLMVRGSGDEIGALYVTASTGAVYSMTYDLSIEEVFYNHALEVYPGITLGPYLETSYVPGDIIDLTSYVEV